MIISRFFPAALDPVQLTPMRIIAPDLLVCFILAVAAWIMSKIEGRRLGQYGLHRSEALRACSLPAVRCLQFSPCMACGSQVAAVHGTAS